MVTTGTTVLLAAITSGVYHAIDLAESATNVKQGFGQKIAASRAVLLASHQLTVLSTATK
jgi:hypothetical protein